MGKDLRLLVPAIAWAMAVPYLAEAAGLRLGVERRVEIVDHVIPGAIALAGCVLSGGLGGAALVFLAGLFITTAHVPLIADLLAGVAPAAPALLHLTAGPPILVIGARLLRRSLR